MTDGEQRWPSALMVAVAIVLQLALPQRLAFQPHWLLPAIEGLLVVGLLVRSPKRIDGSSPELRAFNIGLVAVISTANAWSAVRLINSLLTGHGSSNAKELLATGGAVWLTNVIVFALWYWELDRGGPGARALGESDSPDFLFPQMTDDRFDRDWEPNFIDYFYVSFTNATAFSPTDALPLTRSMKLMMLAQSAVSLATVVLVIARAVNILK